MSKPALVLGLMLSLAPVARAQEPICIIDGVRRPTSDCSGISPRPRALDAANIERIEVLKGPAAAAMYGPDAARGVISIVTKEGGGGPAPAGDDPLARYLFTPELVMGHQQAIGLTDRQRAAIQEAMKEAQEKFVDLQFRMSAEVEKLQRLIQGTSVDEERVLDQVDRVLSLEREIKHAQLTLLVRVKNQLTEQQQAALGRLRD